MPYIHLCIYKKGGGKEGIKKAKKRASLQSFVLAYSLHEKRERTRNQQHDYPSPVTSAIYESGPSMGQTKRENTVPGDIT